MQVGLLGFAMLTHPSLLDVGEYGSRLAVSAANPSEVAELLGFAALTASLRSPGDLSKKGRLRGPCFGRSAGVLDAHPSLSTYFFFNPAALASSSALSVFSQEKAV